MGDELSAQLAAAVQMLQAGQVPQARMLLKRLQKAHPKNTDVIFQLAITERLQKNWREAIALLQKASALAPDNLLYTEHLAMALMLSNEGRAMRQAIDKFAAVLRGRPDFYAVGANLLVVALRNDLPQPVLAAIAPRLAQGNLIDGERLHYAAACAIAAYLIDDMVACADFVEDALRVRHAAFDSAGAPVGDLYFMLIYAEFLRELLAFRAAHPALYASGANARTLHVIGESHSLTSAQLAWARDGAHWRAQPHLIMGAKAYFFSTDAPNAWKDALQEIIGRAPKGDAIAVGFGELDCRAREGFMVQHRRDAGYDMGAAVEALCTQYVRFVKIAQMRRTGRSCILGVPAPNRIVVADLQPGEEEVFTRLIRHFNAALAREAAAQQLGFIDLHALTVDSDGWAKPGMHIDNVHLLPSVVAQALQSS